ncbi:MAG: tocopherol cyclase family protein [Acholeplasmataceae bacterium]
MYFKKIKNPELFQGDKKSNHYFEGWYYKLVSADLKTSIAFIPGISIQKKDPHTFIQVFISSQDDFKMHYYRFDSDVFTYSHDSFSVNIDNNVFTLKSIDINLKDPSMQIFGVVHFRDHKSLNKNLYQPNIMGPFAYLPFMECNHGVISMQSHLKGTLTINNKEIDFTNGKAYIEKDWGKSFPKAYIWLQSNHFKNDKTSLMFSYATIPFSVLSFKGLIVNLLFNDKEYRFATYNMTKIIKKEIRKDEIDFILKKGKYKLYVYAKKDKEIELKSPSLGIMNQTIKEGLSGIIRIKLYEKDKLIYEDEGLNAGIEIMM